jgi:hypothetical protein
MITVLNHSAQPEEGPSAAIPVKQHAIENQGHLFKGRQSLWLSLSFMQLQHIFRPGLLRPPIHLASHPVSR